MTNPYEGQIKKFTKILKPKLGKLAETYASIFLLTYLYGVGDAYAGLQLMNLGKDGKKFTNAIISKLREMDVGVPEFIDNMLMIGNPYGIVIEIMQKADFKDEAINKAVRKYAETGKLS
jgi:hypothetical protein